MEQHVIAGTGDMQYTDRMALALRFINTTNRHVYLTGKAGTGKTTFLRSLPQQSYKSMIIVAPTGIAALNAGGTTVHSQFLLPFGMFVPDRSYAEPPDEGANWYTAHVLARRHPLNSIRKQVLRAIDVLIIDEVSMLRADLLDAIDYRLRSVRNSFHQPFGGVQLLLIGDLFQLPPVVKREEEPLMQKFYKSSWFFESLALQQAGFAYVELDRIFRQRDQGFVDLLNNLRNNCVTLDDVHTLNRHYRLPAEIKSLGEVITLTTHNYKADNMNRHALDALATVPHTFDAVVENEFPENLYPVSFRLILKEGAQIMFVRNDPEGQYFNGKLATVTAITDDTVTVRMAESETSYVLQRLRWENKRYFIDDETKELNEEVTGTFSQYPVKLAWAITVHKSQGLTFDRAIIDVGAAFADGQVYVALSRLRSLDGLILRTRVNPEVVSTDSYIVSFDAYHNKPETLEHEIANRQKHYLFELAGKTFDFQPLLREVSYLVRNHPDAMLNSESMTDIPTQISAALSAQTANTVKFRAQLHLLLEHENVEGFLERLAKGMDYYKTQLLEHRCSLTKHIQRAKAAKQGRRYLNDLDDLDQLLAHQWAAVSKVCTLAEGVLRKDESFNMHGAKMEHASARSTLADARAEVEQEIKAAQGSRKKRRKKKK